MYADIEELRDEQRATFAMYRFKVEKCWKQFVHDWKECPCGELRKEGGAQIGAGRNWEKGKKTGTADA